MKKMIFFINIIMSMLLINVSCTSTDNIGPLTGDWYDKDGKELTLGMGDKEIQLNNNPVAEKIKQNVNVEDETNIETDSKPAQYENQLIGDWYGKDGEIMMSFFADKSGIILGEEIQWKIIDGNKLEMQQDPEDQPDCATIVSIKNGELTLATKYNVLRLQNNPENTKKDDSTGESEEYNEIEGSNTSLIIENPYKRAKNRASNEMSSRAVSSLTVSEYTGRYELMWYSDDHVELEETGKFTCKDAIGINGILDCYYSTKDGSIHIKNDNSGTTTTWHVYPKDARFTKQDTFIFSIKNEKGSYIIIETVMDYDGEGEKPENEFLFGKENGEHMKKYSVDILDLQTQSMITVFTGFERYSNNILTATSITGPEYTRLFSDFEDQQNNEKKPLYNNIEKAKDIIVKELSNYGIQFLLDAEAEEPSLNMICGVEYTAEMSYHTIDHDGKIEPTLVTMNVKYCVQ